jgi:putative ABC transport system substrate-binding protein
MIHRRDFITLLGGAAAAWPLAASAQQAKIPMVGILFAGAPQLNGDEAAALRRGLTEAGFVEGRNITIEERWTDNEPDRASELAADLVNRDAAVIVTNRAGPALQAKAVTARIPIVFVAFVDAVQVGLVASLARPGGNATGINTMSAALGTKRFELLHDLLPRAVRVGVLVDPAQQSVETDIAFGQAAAKTMGLSLEVLTARNSRDIDSAFARAAEQHLDALVIPGGTLFLGRRVQMTTLAARHGLPVMFPNRKFAEVGGLMSYSIDSNDQVRQAGIYVGRILKGEKPADMPVLQPTKFELVINLQTARILSLEVPPTLLAIADEVIE